MADLEALNRLFAEAFSELEPTFVKQGDGFLSFSGEVRGRDAGVLVRWKEEPMENGALAAGLVDEIRKDIRHELAELDAEGDDDFEPDC